MLSPEVVWEIILVPSICLLWKINSWDCLSQGLTYIERHTLKCLSEHVIQNNFSSILHIPCAFFFLVDLLRSGAATYSVEEISFIWRAQWPPVNVLPFLYTSDNKLKRSSFSKHKDCWRLTRALLCHRLHPIGDLQAFFIGMSSLACVR